MFYIKHREGRRWNTIFNDIQHFCQSLRRFLQMCVTICHFSKSSVAFRRPQNNICTGLKEVLISFLVIWLLKGFTLYSILERETIVIYHTWWSYNQPSNTTRQNRIIVPLLIYCITSITSVNTEWSTDNVVCRPTSTYMRCSLYLLLFEHISFFLFFFFTTHGIDKLKAYPCLCLNNLPC